MEVIIIEDSLEDWEYLKYMLEEGGFSYFPIEEKDFFKIRRNIRKLYSPKELLKEEAEDDFKILFKKHTIILLDYQLSDDIDAINGLELYRRLKLTQKTLIYTNERLPEIKDIEINLKTFSLNHNFIICQKPKSLSETYKSKKNIDYLSSKIKELIGLDGKNTQKVDTKR